MSQKVNKDKRQESLKQDSVKLLNSVVQCLDGLAVQTMVANYLHLIYVTDMKKDEKAKFNEKRLNMLRHMDKFQFIQNFTADHVAEAKRKIEEAAKNQKLKIKTDQKGR